MVKHSHLSLAFCAVLFASVLGTSGPQYSSMGKRQNQIVFPPANGPCPQNRGQTPFSCFAKDCVDNPGPGLCNIQTQQGFPICGCCTNDEVFCSACGGDAGGGICKGTGTSGVAFQGCACSTDDGIDPGDATKVCPEHKADGSNTFTCDNPACGGCTTPGICDNKFPGKDSAGKSFFVRCAGCPAGDINCDTCGGDDGNGRCSGQTGSAVGTPYQGCHCGKDGTTVPPPIFPFPIPPPAFPPIPPGTPQPKKKCPDVPTDKCSDCGGKDNWCQEGDSAGCMCTDDCPTGDNQPVCSADDCKGEEAEKCTVGAHVDCACKKEDPQCPEGDDILGCDECGGADDQGKCKGLTDQNNKWKDCDCIDLTDEEEGYDAFSDADYDMWDRIKAALPPANSPGGGDKPRDHPSGNPTCGGNQVDSIPSQVTTDQGNKSPKDLQYMMREVLCNDQCQSPPGIPSGAVAATPDNDGCEIAIVLPNSVEAYAYRGTHSQGLEWQDCWDSFANITETCVKDNPATGWVNGPDPYQFYQSGYRKLNGEGSKHAPLDGSKALPDASSGGGGGGDAKEVVIPVTSPGSNGVQCTADDRGGFMADCWHLADKYTDDQQICSNDANVCPQPRTNSICKATGAQCDPNGAGSIDVSSYCVIGQQSSCAIVLADKLSSFGGNFPGFYCTTGKELKQLIALEASANGCGGTPDQGRVALWPVNGGKSTLCMTGAQHPGVCGA